MLAGSSATRASQMSRAASVLFESFLVVAHLFAEAAHLAVGQRQVGRQRGIAGRLRFKLLVEAQAVFEHLIPHAFGTRDRRQLSTS